MILGLFLLIGFPRFLWSGVMLQRLPIRPQMIGTIIMVLRATLGYVTILVGKIHVFGHFRNLLRSSTADDNLARLTENESNV